jgi:hypothetical protein
MFRSALAASPHNSCWCEPNSRRRTRPWRRWRLSWDFTVVGTEGVPSTLAGTAAVHTLPIEWLDILMRGQRRVEASIVAQPIAAVCIVAIAGTALRQ